MELALENIKYVMDSIAGDGGVPKNIKKSVSDARGLIFAKGQNDVNFTRAMYLLDEVLNDINMPFHTRTELMGVVSELERMKEQMK